MIQTILTHTFRHNPVQETSNRHQTDGRDHDPINTNRTGMGEGGGTVQKVCQSPPQLVYPEIVSGIFYHPSIPSISWHLPSSATIVFSTLCSSPLSYQMLYLYPLLVMDFKFDEKAMLTDPTRMKVGVCCTRSNYSILHSIYTREFVNTTS